MQSAFLAAEVLTNEVGLALAQIVNIMPTVNVQNVVGKEATSAHFRSYNNVTASSFTEGNSLPVVTESPSGVVITAVIDGIELQVGKMLTSVAPRVLSDFANLSAEAIARIVDSTLAALYPLFTGGTINKTGAALTLQDILTSVANLNANFAYRCQRGTPYFGRLQSHQMLNLTTDAMSKNWGLNKIDVNIQSGQQQLVVGGAVLVENNLVPSANSGVDWCGAVYANQAIGMVVAQEPLIEALPIYGQHAWALDGTVGFGAGVWRPTVGCAIISGKNA